jgi:3-oxoacyl-[acyl-carrier protein] reductase
MDNLSSLLDKRALITGASRGIGAAIQALLDVNIRSAILACRSAIPHLWASGRIINIGSVAADRVPFPGCSIYSLTKASLVGLTRGLARDLAPRGITVNIVHPGATNTDANPSGTPMADQIRSLIPLGRYSEPDDIAAMVAYLAGPDARQIIGAAFTVDGGTNA